EQLSLILKGNDGGRQWPERIAVRTGVRMTFLRVCTIEWLQSEGNYVRLFANGSAQLVRGTMNGIQDKLDPGQFLRIHRSAIVNIDFIKELRARRTGDYTVRMLGGKEFTLTRTYRSSLARLLEAVPPA
ncbi:MAG TPA: LytTR family DNA-binding domain-containing protein, partial [Candidatus Saccharimonadales bacterium]|nr:LytTR family DNA-binding domain-containing protein [Candidatus Saccharimonadales bacterium]